MFQKPKIVFLVATFIVLAFGLNKILTPIENGTQKTISEIKGSAINFIDCKNQGVFQSKQFSLKFDCPKDYVIYECQNDINLLSPEELDQKIKNYKTYGDTLCDGQGKVQIAVSDTTLYRYLAESDDHKYSEKRIFVDANPAIHQIVEYEGANQPPYSEFITFRNNNKYYRIRTLDKEGVGALNIITESLRFNN